MEEKSRGRSLFICTGNSVRSIFAEAILRAEGGDRFNVYSAGTRPYSALNPITLRILEEHGHATGMLRSKNIAEFQGSAAPKMDFVFTVCDQAADEECPAWPGQPLTAHWGHPDPVKVEGSDAVRYTAFRETYHSMTRRIQPFAQLGFEALGRSAIQREVDGLGRLPRSA